MACINMFNSEHQGLCGAPPPMSPRISFSNDFVVINPAATAAAATAAPAPPDPNFEFSAPHRPMMAADELFFKGRMLPLRGDTTTHATRVGPTTLRDELQAPDDGHVWGDVAGRAGSRGSAIRWRGLLGLKKPHCSSKKNDKGDGSPDPEANTAKSSEELQGDVI